MRSDSRAAVCIGASSDGRTNRWRLTCPRCGGQFEPPTTMFNRQGLDCPRRLCGAALLADYEAETVRVVRSGETNAGRAAVVASPGRVSC